MLTRSEIVELLRLRGREQQELFEHAVSLREREFGQLGMVRGVIEITNLCRVNCHYCPMRLANTRRNEVYLMRPDEIVETSRIIRDCGIRIVFLQGGEIPQTTRLVGEVIPEIRRIFDGNVEILLCLGNKTVKDYAYLKEQGADSYILKHETADPLLHERVRESSWFERKRCLADLLHLGYRVGTGVIVGLPHQSFESLADDIIFAKELGAHMMSASPFLPAQNTPLEQQLPGDLDTTLNLIAVSRIIEPKWLIPSVSALEKLRKGGHVAGMRAGANVMTANFTSPSRQSNYLIYGGNRFIVQQQHIWAVLRNAGLRPDLNSSCAEMGSTETAGLIASKSESISPSEVLNENW
ncbi:MAG: biotin synthase [Acidobacteriota bacterium]|nr:biotin synthase [Acidobacteriota bacterium]